MQPKSNNNSTNENFIKRTLSFFGNFGHILSYMVLIGIYTVLSFVRKFSTKAAFFVKIEKSLYRLVHALDRHQTNSISRVELIDLALQNMKSKKSRTVITVGGMTIGIAAIVFLVSIGYGLQALVINRVARLEEMRQTDVSTQPGSKLTINQDVIKVIETFPEVETVLPQIAVVGKVNFNNSLTDMAAYGVTSNYLKQSAIAPVVGEIFENNYIDSEVTIVTQDVETDKKGNVQS